jgi:hypothetical protein
MALVDGFALALPQRRVDEEDLGHAVGDLALELGGDEVGHHEVGVGPVDPPSGQRLDQQAFDFDDRFSSHADVGSSRWHFWDAGLHPATEAERAQVGPGLLDVGQTCLPVAMGVGLGPARRQRAP